MKSIIVGAWNGKTGEFFEGSYLYHGISRKQGIINFIEQYFNNNYCTHLYPKELKGIKKSNMVKDRLVYGYSEDIVIFSQYA